MRKICDTHEIARCIETDEVVDPGEGGDVGDRVYLAHDPGAVRELPVQYTKQALRFRNIAIARTLVLVVLARKFIEESDLAEHGANAAHLKHQPLNGPVALGGRRRHELPRFFGEVNQ